MRKKRIMVIGPHGSGKTTLVDYLNGKSGTPRKTPDVIYGKNTIDIPSAYIETTWMYKNLIALSQDASKIVVLVDQSNCREVYSHGFAILFKCPVIGVISKCDLKVENREKCLKQLKNIGISEPYFSISATEKIGIDTLKDYLLGTGEVEK
ncbi:MAG: EutP/PduV family microcompartment system protein [Clostridioides sp.]|jgi:ethanolamine utilization protein EutP|nr:EutP/PduV family microcompartment system protein [Clostridioides sp.]